MADKFDWGAWSPYDGLPALDATPGWYGEEWGHKGLPYYGVDIASLLAQLNIPGAASAAAFNSRFLEPQRQQGVRDQLGMLTQSGANTASDNYTKAGIQGAYGRADQSAASLYGSGGGGRNFKASSLLSAMNQANEAGGAYRAKTTDPFAIAQKRNHVITQGMNSPMANNLGQWLPGVEQQRQDHSFFGDLLNTGLQLWGSGAFGGSKKK